MPPFSPKNWERKPRFAQKWCAHDRRGIQLAFFFACIQLAFVFNHFYSNILLVDNFLLEIDKPTTKDIRSNPHHEKERILQILQEAGINEVDEETIQKLPTWSTVTALYGDRPRIYGLDTCEDFRDRTDVDYRFLSVAGTFNTGTNLFFQLLDRNCRFPFKDRTRGFRIRGVEWQVPWGKHRAPYDEEFRQTHKEQTGRGIDTDSVLPAVTIRDPYTWMKSACKMPYNMNWKHVPEHCPNLVPNRHDREAFPKDPYNESVPVRIMHQREDLEYHDSLAHVWNGFYGVYKNAEYPRIMVRMEDLVFFAKQVTETVCDCAGGEMNRTEFRYVVDTAKTGGAHDGATEKTSLIGAMIKYGTSEGRFEGFEKEDLSFAEKTLDRKLMEFFGYSDPIFSMN